MKTKFNNAWAALAAVAAFGASQGAAYGAPAPSLAEQVGRVVPRDIYGRTAGVVSPDGTRAAFTEWEHGGGRSLWLLDLTRRGADPTRLTHSAGQISAPAWSADGASLIYADTGKNRQGIWRFDLDAASETRIFTTQAGKVTRPRSTADGRVTFQVVAATHTEVWASSIDGRRTERLTRLPKDADWSALSPDGQRIAFFVGKELRLLQLKDAATRTLASGLTVSKLTTGPVWSSDGETLMLAAARTPDFASRAWSVPVGTGELKRMDAFDHEVAGLSVSKAGRVLYALNAVQTTIGVADIASQTVAPVAGASRGSFLPSWMPDGRRVAAISGSWIELIFPDSLDIVAYSLDAPANAKAPVLIDGHGEDYGVDWSSDQRWLAFHSHRNRSDDIYVRAADGGPIIPVSQFAGHYKETGEPDWSPDGSALTYVAASGHKIGSSAVWVSQIDPATGQPVGKPKQIALRGFAGDAYASRFSPDGRSISFHGRLEGSWACDCIVPAAGGDVRTVSRYRVDQGYSPAEWSPDGRYLFSTRQQETRGPFRVWRIDIESGESKPVTPRDVSALHPAISKDGARLAVTIFDNATEYWLTPATPAVVSRR